MNARSAAWLGGLAAGLALGLILGGVVFKIGSTSGAQDMMTSAAGAGSSALRAGDPRETDTLGRVEELFMAWGGYCVWQEDRTQFAVWNGRKARHADFYEVVRSESRFFFRTLPQADWPLIDHGRLARCALWFAEPPGERDRFYRDHGGPVPAGPELSELPKRPPLLASAPSRQEEIGNLPASIKLTPGRFDESLVPPWEAAQPEGGKAGR